MLTIIIQLGMTKMIINHIEKIFVTSDAATIMTQVKKFSNIIFGFLVKKFIL